MNNGIILGIMVLLLSILLLLSSQQLIVINGNGTGTGNDTNKVTVSLTDQNAGYLLSKLQAGSNITLTQQNTGGNENILVSSSGGSSTDTNASCTVTVASSGADYTNPSDAVDALKTSGGRVCIGPGTFQLTRSIDINGSNIEIIGSGVATNIRTNPISIPTAIRFPTGSQISNVRIKNIQISASTSLGNGTAIDASNLAIGHISDVYINGYNHGIDFNKNNTFYNEIDNVRISVSGIGSFGIRFIEGANDQTVFRTRIITDGNGTGVIVNTHGVSLYETNVESGSAIGIDIQSLGNDATVIAPYLESNIINLQIASGVYGFSLFGGTIQSGTSANIKDLGASKPVFTGMKIGFASAPSTFGDINALDINTSTMICIKGDCRSAWPTSGGGGSGTTYTSGTPATIQVNNDTNTISQNFDGNFYSKLNPLVPWKDVNIFSATRWDADVNWQEVSLLFPVADSNIAQAGLYKATCDNNSACTFTGKITTIMDVNAKNGKFTGTLSADDFNYSLNDANDSQNCGANTVLQSVGGIKTCVSIPNEDSIDGNAFAAINSLDLNNSLSYSKNDTNCAVSGSCVNVAYVDKNVNFLDVNGWTYTAQQPGQYKFVYGDLNTGVKFANPGSGCVQVFGVTGLLNTGLEFCGIPTVGITLRVLGVYNFFFEETTGKQGFLHQRVQTGPLNTPNLTTNSGVTGWQSNADFNSFMCYINTLIGWKGCGNYMSNSIDFNFSQGTIRNDINLTGDDINFQKATRLRFENDSNVTGAGGADLNFQLPVSFQDDLNAGKRIIGELFGCTAQALTSCTTQCNNFDVNGYDMTCLHVVSIAGAATSCSDTTLTRSCMCETV